MAIFSFRPPAGGRRRKDLQPPDWDDTRPVEFADSALAAAVVDTSAFADSDFAESEFAPGLNGHRVGPRAAVPPGLSASIVADSIPVGPNGKPHPGFAKNLTARPQDDEPLGAGWYISSWDLLQGCDVIEGAPIDLLPPEWQRKRPRA